MARTYADTSGTGPLAFVDDVSVQGHMLIRYHFTAQMEQRSFTVTEGKTESRERPTNKQQWLQ